MRSANWKNKMILSMIFILGVILVQSQTLTDNSNNKNKKISFEKSIFIGSFTNWIFWTSIDVFH